MKPRRSDERAREITVRPLTKRDWPVIEQLFGDKGACGGCWCMVWRLRSGKEWETNKGEPNRRAFRKLVEAGAAHGVLAFVGDECVGWCNIGPKSDYKRLRDSRVLRTDTADDPWSVTCFYVPAKWRGKGVGGKLLAGAIELARVKKARVLEGYPVPQKSASAIPAAFAWTGVKPLFTKARFTALKRAAGSRPVYVKRLSASSARANPSGGAAC